MSVYESGKDVTIQLRLENALGLGRSTLLMPKEVLADVFLPTGGTVLSNAPVPIYDGIPTLTILASSLTIPGTYVVTFKVFIGANTAVRKDVTFKVAPKTRPKIAKDTTLRQLRRKGHPSQSAAKMIQDAENYDQVVSV